MEFGIQHATESQIVEIADLWHAGWHDAHAQIVPQELTQLRNLESFVVRTTIHLPDMRIASANGKSLGMCITLSDELFQLYVAPTARGTGLAPALMADAERLFRSRGLSRVWLASAIGNHRAAKFYKKCGWNLVRAEFDDVDTSKGLFALEVWRFEKQMAD